MTSAAKSVLPLLHSLPMQDRLDIAAYLKRGLRSDKRMTAADRKLLKRSLALKPKERRFLADILSILNHPTDSPVEKLFQEILLMSNGLRFEIGWRLDESLPSREPPPPTKQQMAELKRRLKEADSGKAKWISGEEMKARMDALRAKHRAEAEAEVQASRIDWSRSPKKGFVAADDVLDSIRAAFSRQARLSQRRKRPAQTPPKIK
ncbi:addiction module protein [Prosthecobacter sp.]|uniref:addiction module protein n=1 Tax=Prosthecobacter sp. TaxID=1965333 RepID=UPI003783092B